MDFITNSGPSLVKWHEELADEQTLALRLLLGQGDPCSAHVFEATRDLQFGLKDVLYIGIDIKTTTSDTRQEIDFGIALLDSRHIQDCLTGRSDTSGILETYNYRVRPLKCCGKEDCEYTPEKTLIHEINSRICYYGEDREIVLVVYGGEYNSLLLEKLDALPKITFLLDIQKAAQLPLSQYPVELVGPDTSLEALVDKLNIPCEGLKEAGIRAKFILRAMLGIAARDMVNHGIANRTRAVDAFNRIAKYQIPIDRWDDPGYFFRSRESEARRNWRR